jgi:hydrogenase expression/formation protein HypC
MKIIRIDNNIATVDTGGTSRDVSLMLLAEEASMGDYVLVHAGFALCRLDEKSAQETLDLLREMAEKGEAVILGEDCTKSPT